MKHAILRSITHNAADSLASGDCLMIGVFELDVFGEAARSDGGAITVDFLSGEVIEGRASNDLSHAVRLYRNAFGELCARAGMSRDEVLVAQARFWSTPVGRRFAVIIEDARGRRTTTQYAGVPGKRVRILDRLGRLRPRPSES